MLHVICVPINPLVGVSAGATVLTGGDRFTTVIALLFALAEPLPLVAVTTQRTEPPKSPLTGVYVLVVAPLILTALSCH